MAMNRRSSVIVSLAACELVDFALVVSQDKICYSMICVVVSEDHAMFSVKKLSHGHSIDFAG